MRRFGFLEIENATPSRGLSFALRNVHQVSAKEDGKLSNDCLIIAEIENGLFMIISGRIVHF